MAKRKLKDVHFWVPLIVSVTVVAGLGTALYLATRPLPQPTTCPEAGRQIEVNVGEMSAQPMDVEAKRCDSLHFINSGDQTQELMFGTHDKMSDYDGMMSQQIPAGESYDLLLERSGHYQYHFMPGMASGSFSVESNR